MRAAIRPSDSKTIIEYQLLGPLNEDHISDASILILLDIQAEPFH